jgi:predicted Zn-dependent peptidase
VTDEHVGGSPEQPEDPRSRFLTDQDPAADTGEHQVEALDHEPPTATVLAEPDLSVLDVRPRPGPPRDYRFPAFERMRLESGLTVISCHTPGRPLLAANLILHGGAAAEPAELAGVTVLLARMLTEGTQRRDALAFVEAAERLGAEIHADATWDGFVAALEVPRSRFGAALALLAEMAIEPGLPEREVDRLCEERLNDLLQARADPRRRAERVFGETIYAPASAYARPMGGSEETVPELDVESLRQRHDALLATAGATLVVAGDLTDLAVAELAAETFGSWSVPDGAAPPPPSVAGHPAGARLVLVDRPRAPQSEVRIGHLGLPRRTVDFHAAAVLNAVLGGTFDSRLNRLLREDRGYTYSISSSFEMRRAAGPFAVRTAVHTEATVPAVRDALGVLREIRESEVERRELDTARDYLVGVFPLRFEVPAQVCAALSGLVLQDLPDDELDRYRPAVAAITAADVQATARRHVRPDEASIVIIGDAASLEPQLREAEAELGPLTVIAADVTAEALAEAVGEAVEAST